MELLERIKQLRPISFKWTGEAKREFGLYNEGEVGLIAQEVERIFPELVAPIRKGYKTVRYNWLTIYLLVAIQEQQKLIEELSKKISKN